MYLDLLALKLFVDVIECRSVRKAADRNGLALTVAFQRIEHLEKALSAPLLRRHAGSVVPTDAGQQLHLEVTSIFEQLIRTIGKLIGKTATRQPRINLCVSVEEADHSTRPAGLDSPRRRRRVTSAE